MSKFQMTEAELAVAGIVIDPNGTPVRLEDREKPSESMTLAELAIYISQRYDFATRLGRAEAIERFYLGWGIHLAQERCKSEGKHWKDWCAEQGINRMTPNRLRRLYLGAVKKWGDEAIKEVAQRTTTELNHLFGIDQPKKVAQEEQQQRASRGNANDGADDQGADDDHVADGQNTAVTNREDADQPRSIIRIHTGEDGGDATEEQSTEEQSTEEQSTEGDAPEESGTEETTEQTASEDTTAKKTSFECTDRATTKVALRGPGEFELHVADPDKGNLTLVLCRRQIDLLYDQIDYARDEDDATEHDILPQEQVALDTGR